MSMHMHYSCISLHIGGLSSGAFVGGVGGLCEDVCVARAGFLFGLRGVAIASGSVCVGVVAGFRGLAIPATCLRGHVLWHLQACQCPRLSL